MKRTLIVLLILSVSQLNAQAFKGKGDVKLQVGAAFQEYATGIVTTADFGLGENISIGGSVSYLLNTTEAIGTPKFDDRFDAKIRFNANIGNVVNISEKFDLYPGLNLGLRNFGAHIGARYFFTSGFGVYSEAGFPLAKYKPDAVGYERLNNQFVFQIGATFNL